MVRPCTTISGARTERSPMIDASEFALHWGVRPNAARGATPPFTTPMIIIIIIMEIANVGMVLVGMGTCTLQPLPLLASTII